MSKTLKLEISVADLGQNGVVVSEFATTDYVANELSKKATLNAEGKVDPSLLPDYTYVDGLVDKLDDVEQSLLNSDAEILNAAKLYSDNKITENNSKKADLVEGKVPFEQLPFSMNFEQNVSTEFENVREELRQNSESIVSQMDGLVGSANSYTDGKVLEEREFLNNTINEYKGEVNSQLNNFGNEVDDILKSGASLPYDPDLEYIEGALTLKDGEIQQFVEGVWVSFKKTVDASDVKDESGLSQQEINEGITVDELVLLSGIENGRKIYVKEPLNCDFIFSETSAAADGVIVIDGVGGKWIAQGRSKVVYPDLFSKPSDIDDTESFQRALDYVGSIGGGTLLPKKDTYTVRNTNVPSNVVIGAFNIKQRIESEPLSNWAMIKHVFHVEDAENIVFYKTSVDGQRGYQNMDNQLQQNGGCTAWYFAKNARNILLIQPTAHHMGTDAIECYGYVADLPTSGPYNIQVIQPNFYANRRNHISLLSVDGIKVTGGTLATSGIEVDGNQSGRLPLQISSTNPEIWSSPAIDIELEARCTVKNVEFDGVVIDGCRSGWMIYTATPSQRNVQDIRFIDCTIKNPISGKFWEIATGMTVGTVDIIRPRLQGVGNVYMNTGNVLLESPRQLDADNVIKEYAFDSSIFLAVSGDLKLNLIDTKIANYGLITDRYGNTPTQGTFNIRLGFNSFITRQQGVQAPFINTQMDIFARESLPTYISAEDAPFEFANGNLNRNPILWSSRDGNFGMGAGKKTGFLGKYFSEVFSRTLSAAAAEGATVLQLNTASGITVGSKIRLTDTDGRNRTYSVSEVSENSITLSRGIFIAAQNGAVVTVAVLKDWYGVSKQPNIANATAETTVAQLNSLLAALRSANIIGDT